MTSQGVFLFSVDLEDVRSMIPNGEVYKEKVPQMTLKFLDWLDKNNTKATFFVVGSLAEEYPDLIKEIVTKGHEVASHSYSHLHITELGEEGFRKDLNRCLEVFSKLGVSKTEGFRAPTFSLTKDTPWAFKVLSELGFTYSSSVMPVSNPLFGWPGFGERPKKVDNIMEVPMAVSSILGKQIAFSGGVYLRVLPFGFTKRQFKRYTEKGLAVPSYIHPYDIDTTQERFMHPHLNDSKLYNQLMYIGRGKVLDRLQCLVDLGYRIMRYDEYVKGLSDNGI